MGQLVATGPPVRRLALPLLATLLLSGHVGDTNTHFRGSAGPYTVQVVVRHPGVVPGLADITVRVENGPASRVTVRPVHSALGLEGAPRPDVAEPVPGDPDLFAAQLWFMALGAYSVHVEVEGTEGRGIAVVPVNSMATRTLPMSAGLTVTLAALGLFLVVGLLTIVRAAVGESTTPPGEDPGPSRRVRARIAVGVSFVLLFLIGSCGRDWWTDEASAYSNILFVPLELRATPGEVAGARVLELEIADRNWLDQEVRPLVPDHGKLLHGFLVRLPEQDVFAHVHPERTGDFRFHLALPPLPAGTYAFYGDIVHESGFSQTLVTEVDLPEPTTLACDTCIMPDPDDAWWSRGDEESAQEVRFADGVTVHWERPEVISAGRELMLEFAARDANGEPLPLELYMGMAAHAAIRREDGSVFVHLHPSGSISMAMTTAPSTHTSHVTGPPDGRIKIPYAFPEAGRYRMWLQFRGGYEQVRTASWLLEAT
jgi:hypothetical protein